jgi:hypothetical protein
MNYKELDGQILQFGKTEARKAMIATWKDTHIQKGLHGDDEVPKKPAEPMKPE